MFIPSRMFIVLISIIASIHCFNGVERKTDNTKTLSKCDRCKLLVDSFKMGLKQTLRGKHEGGDAHWEENRLGNYRNSEIRLIDIQEQLCHNLPSDADANQCHSFAEEHELVLEKWFFEERKRDSEEGSSLFEYVCNAQLEVCCPDAHYGPECAPCPGYPHNTCNARGYCQGNGTREGTGGCVCGQQYAGDACQQCSGDHFEAEDGDCKPCDQSCVSCHSPGPHGCHVCRPGYMQHPETGCIDIDECVNTTELNPCNESQYCINTQGSFRCYDCHQACAGCDGPGNEGCLECQADYVNIHGACVRRDEQLSHHLPYYVAYACLCLVTYFVSLKSMTLGFILGITFGAYIVLYEFDFIL